MKAYLLLLTLVFVAGSLTGQQQVRAQRANVDIAIRVWLPAGAIQVEGWDHDSIEVHATPGRGSQFVGGGTADAAKFAVEWKQGGGNELPSGQLRLKVPRQARLWIKSTTASVAVQGMGGELDVLQVDGSITLRDLAGVVTVEAIDGSIDIDRVTGVTRIRGGSAVVTVGDVRGNLNISSVTGPVSFNWPIGATEAVRARVTTVSGTVQLTGGLPPASTVDIETHDGRVDLRVPRSNPPEIRTTGGTTRIAPGLATPDGKRGMITIYTFKGVVNASTIGGI